MADAVSVTVAKAITAAIGGHQFGLPFTIERNYATLSEELEDITPLRVDVCPVKHATADMRTRGRLNYETETDICIRRKFGLPDQDPNQQISLEAIDLLVKFTEDVHEFLVAQQLSTDSKWSESLLLWCPNKRHLRKRQFTSLIRVTHLTGKAIP